MNTQEVVATVASISVASDLALHLWNYGIPRVWDMSTYGNPQGLQNVATITGVGATAVVSGIASEDLKNAVDALPTPYDRIIGKSAVASAFLSSKAVVQTAVVIAYSMLIPDGANVRNEYMMKQLAPSIVLNSVVAFAVPYATSK